MTKNILLDLFIIFLVGKTVAELILLALNRTEVLKHKDKVPEAFKGFVDQAAYEKTIQYTLAKNTLGFIEAVYEAVILAVVVLSGCLPWIFYGLQTILGTSLWAQAFILIVMSVGYFSLSLPLDWYSQFRIEERFGFNKSTVTLWVKDRFKAALLITLLGMPLLWLILKFFIALPNNWWLLASGSIFIFQLLMMILYPQFILPLFNKLEPLKDRELKRRLMQLSNRTGFSASSIEVIDGSKRSGHSNAFFTGMGRFRKIVLFDTLLEQLEPEEIEAVLAHEIGHFIKEHVPKTLVISGISTFLSFGAIAWLMGKPWFLQSFGFTSSEIAPTIFIFFILSGLLTFWLSPVLNWLSRKHEYEADAFAKKVMESEEPLIRSLRKISEGNLANLIPHPLFSAFYYSHPTLIEREKALRRD